MEIILITHIVYTSISVCLTIWVAKTLHQNGRLFLIDAFQGDEARGDAVNQLLVVGFYLINIGFIMLFLSWGGKPESIIEGVELISKKLGVVLLVLGGMHFFNMYNFNKMRRKGKRPQTESVEQAA